MSERELRRLYSGAELIINLHGGTEPLPEHYETGRLVYLETDPVQLQIELYDEPRDALEFLEPHVAFFTFGENYGKPGCGLPVSERFTFQPTRQPVVLDFWLGGGAGQVARSRRSATGGSPGATSASAASATRGARTRSSGSS